MSYTREEAREYYAKNKERILKMNKAAKLRREAMKTKFHSPLSNKVEFAIKANSIQFRIVEAPKPGKYDAIIEAYNSMNGSGNKLEITRPDNVKRTKFKNAIYNAFYLKGIKPNIEATEDKVFVSKT